MSNTTVAAASLANVYKSTLPSGEAVAVKVQRPDVRLQVAADAVLLRSGAAAVESLRNLRGERLVKAAVVDAVDEFMSRLFEEMDFENEARNLGKFSELYGAGSTRLPAPGVRVPALYPALCSPRVVTMEWLDGTKLLDGTTDDETALALVELGIECTLSQLLDTGVMHADPHAGNLLQVEIQEEGGGEGGAGRGATGKGSGKPKPKRMQLAYLDFGLVSEVPVTVRDGLVCAVVLLVGKEFEKVG